MIRRRLLGQSRRARRRGSAPERVDRHRPDRLRVAGRAEALDAVAVEQRHDDAGFDVGGRGEDDDGHVSWRPASQRSAGRVTALRPPPPPSAAPSSCRPAARAARRTPSTSLRMRSRSSSDGRSACSLHQAGEPRVAEAVAVRVHRLGDAIRVEQEQIAGAERQRHFLEQAVERASPSSICSPSTRPSGVSICGCARRGVRPGHVDQRAMAGARVRAACAPRGRRRHR